MNYKCTNAFGYERTLIDCATPHDAATEFADLYYRDEGEVPEEQTVEVTEEVPGGKTFIFWVFAEWSASFYAEQHDTALWEGRKPSCPSPASASPAIASG